MEPPINPLTFSPERDRDPSAGYWIVLLLGLVVWVAGFLFLNIWGLILLAIPVGLLLLQTGRKGLKRARNRIVALEFEEEKLAMMFVGGKRLEVPYTDLEYAMIVKKYFQPVRQIEFRAGGGSGLRRSKNLGRISVSAWKGGMKEVAVMLVRNGIARRRWHFRWGLGEWLMLFSLLLGTEGEFDSIPGAMGNLGAELSEGGESRKKKLEMEAGKWAETNRKGGRK